MKVEIVDNLLVQLEMHYGAPKSGFTVDYNNQWFAAFAYSHVQAEDLPEAISRFLAAYRGRFFPTVGEFLELSGLKQRPPRAAKQPKLLESKNSEDWVAMEQEYKAIDRRMDPVAATKFLWATSRAPYGYNVIDTEDGIGVVYAQKGNRGAGPPIAKPKGPVRFADLVQAVTYGE